MRDTSVSHIDSLLTLSMYLSKKLYVASDVADGETHQVHFTLYKFFLNSVDEFYTYSPKYLYTNNGT